MLDYKFRMEQTENVTFRSVAEFLFGQEDGTLPKSLELEQAKLIYSAYKIVVDRMNEKLRILYEKLCLLVNESPVIEMDQAGGQVGVDAPDLDLNQLDMSKPYKVADSILNNLNSLAGRNVILQH